MGFALTRLGGVSSVRSCVWWAGFVFWARFLVAFFPMSVCILEGNNEVVDLNFVVTYLLAMAESRVYADS